MVVVVVVVVVVVAAAATTTAAASFPLVELNHAYLRSLVGAIPARGFAIRCVEVQGFRLQADHLAEGPQKLCSNIIASEASQVGQPGTRGLRYGLRAAGHGADPSQALACSVRLRPAEIPDLDCSGKICQAMPTPNLWKNDN